MKDLWVSKYRPKTLDGYVFKDQIQKKKIERWISDGSLPHMLLSGPPGTGKAQPLDAKIKTPSGWTTMGEIKVGDIISIPNGNTSSVTGVFPQGQKDIYKITFADGRTAECCKEHLWKIYRKDLFNPKKNNGSTRGWKIFDLEWIKNQIETTEYDLYIPLVLPENLSDINLPLDPYLMGVMLGDGSFRSRSFGFTTADLEIIDNISTKLPENTKMEKKNNHKYGYVFRCIKREKFLKIRSIIKQLGLIDKLSHEKFIPEIYKKSSLKQKEDLIAGLVDTDGYIDKRTGSLSISTSSEQMAKDIQEIIWSMGGIAKITSKIPTHTYKGEKKKGLRNYNISVRYTNSKNLSQLSRKKDYIPENYQYKDLKLRIEKVEFLGKKEAQCIMIDHPDHLYITDNYVVTHNTALIKVLLNELKVDPFDVLEVNASKNRGIDFIRDKVSNFISTMGVGEMRYVFLDEADKLTSDAQGTLRGMMEEFETSARFLLTCNNLHLISDAIKSRCSAGTMRIEKSNRDEFETKLIEILTKENIEIDFDAFTKIADKTYPDLRRGISLCEANSLDGKLQSPDDDTEQTSDMMTDVVVLFKAGRFREGREMICTKLNLDEYEHFYRFLYNNIEIWADTDMKANLCIIAIRDGLFKHRSVADPEINLSATICELENISKGQ